MFDRETPGLMQYITMLCVEISRVCEQVLCCCLEKECAGASTGGVSISYWHTTQFELEVMANWLRGSVVHIRGNSYTARPC